MADGVADALDYRSSPAAVADRGDARPQRRLGIVQGAPEQFVIGFPGDLFDDGGVGP